MIPELLRKVERGPHQFIGISLVEAGQTGQAASWPSTSALIRIHASPFQPARDFQRDRGLRLDGLNDPPRLDGSDLSPTYIN
jgi:hypothetical protein